MLLLMNISFLSKQHTITTPSDTECFEDIGNCSGTGDCLQNLKVFNDLDKNRDSLRVVVLDTHENLTVKVGVSQTHLRYLNGYCE